MNQIIFEVPGKPHGKARARTFYNAATRKMKSITPDQTANYENLIKILFLSKRPVGFSKTENPVRVIIEAYFIKAKSNKMPLPMLKPDADNICKVVLDSLNGIAYKDDSQVIDARISKYWGTEEKLSIRLEYKDVS